MISWDDAEDILLLQDDLNTVSGRAAKKDILREIRGIVAKAVEEIPREWLIPGAPEKLDWSSPDSYGYLQRDKMWKLIGIVSGSDPESASGN